MKGSAFEIPDASGAVLPGPAGASIDAVQAWVASRLADRALAQLAGCAPVGQPAVAATLASLHAAVSALPPTARIAAFRTALAHDHLRGDRIAPDPVGSALRLVRFLVGAPDISVCLVLPPEALPAAGLYLPHLHALLDGGAGPVAVESGADRVRFTWLDGVVADVPAEGVDAADADPADDEAAGPRLRWLPRVAGWPLLNGLPELREAPIEMEPQPHPEPSAREREEFEAGVALLRSAWPAADAACGRYFDSVLLQPLLEAHTTSVTLERLHGAFITSILDAVQVAEALCHEGSHTRLALLLMVDPLLENGPEAVHPSPWRSDPRPLRGLLNGIHAFVNVCVYYQRVAQQLPSPERAEMVFKEQRARVRTAWKHFAPRARPTPVGASLLTDLEREVKAL